MGLVQIYQIKVDKQKNSVVIDLNSFFYPAKLLGKTAGAFHGVCKTKIKPVGSRAIVELRPKSKTNLRLLAMNFCNYCLASRQSPEEGKLQ